MTEKNKNSEEYYKYNPPRDWTKEKFYERLKKWALDVRKDKKNFGENSEHREDKH